MKEKVVLAYSGGLDTTAIIPWLKEHFNYDVVCCCIDCGQNYPALLNYTLRTWLTILLRTTLFLVFRQTQPMRTSIY